MGRIELPVYIVINGWGPYTGEYVLDFNYAEGAAACPLEPHRQVVRIKTFGAAS